MAVATTILEQLGGQRFQVMTGAKQFAGSITSLQFGIPGHRSAHGINKVVILLNESDLYDLTFFKIRGVKVQQLFQVDNVGAEQLREVFTHFTGLETSLGTMGR